MHFTINRNTLLKELNAIIRIVEKKQTIPILASLLLKAEGEQITIKGSDLDLSLITTCEATVKTPGAMCLSAKKLFEIVKALPDATIEFKLGKADAVTITCEQAKFKMLGQPEINFPIIPEYKTTLASLPAHLLQQFVNYTIFAATNEESRFALFGAKFELSPTNFRMVATDGHRLALVEKTGNYETESLENTRVEVLIPKKSLIEVAKLCAETDSLVEFSKDEHHVFFRAGNRTLASRTLSGQFPNYEMILPANNHQKFVLESQQLSAAVRRVALMADERSHAVKLEIGNNQIILSSQSSDVGEAGETLPLEYNGTAIEVGINASYLAEYLGVIGDTQIRLEMKDGNSQIEIQLVNDEDFKFRYVIMPLRL